MAEQMQTNQSIRFFIINLDLNEIKDEIVVGEYGSVQFFSVYDKSQPHEIRSKSITKVQNEMERITGFPWVKPIKYKSDL